MDTKVKALRALADENRLNIIDMLSCGERCACDIVEGLSLTQPTVSHHLKILQSVGLVDIRKDGKWRIFSLNRSSFSELSTFIESISTDKTDCICYNVDKSCEC